MSETIVLLHGSANGSYAWRPIREALVSSGASVFAPDMLGYGKSPPPGDSFSIRDEVDHLKHTLDREGIGELHLVAHSLGSMFGLHLRRALGKRVTRLTLIDPVLVSVLQEKGEEAGYAEMEAMYQRFMSLFPDHEAAARLFVDHWSGRGAWDTLGAKARAMITSLVPRLRLELLVTRADQTGLAFLAADPPPTTLLVGEKTRVAPRAVARQLEPAFHATTIVVPGAGHMIPLTHPDAIVEILQDRETL